MIETDIIWLLLFIGYAIGLIPIAILGIMGTNEAINYQNKLNKSFERSKKNEQL
tara:strand:+ start:228 stop:389 length:162 start_codon:yes stop_codon:yes gene_type:complete